LTVFAAGALCWREAEGRLLVAVVHRSRYDDWSWPKGKVDPGESLPQAAVREIREETGLKVKLGVKLGIQEYKLANGAQKEVHYWAAKVSESALAKSKFKPDDEVESVNWFSVDEARQKMTYKQDLEYLDALVDLHKASMLATKPFIVLRHAQATPRADWNDEDGKRPLLPTGLVQARALIPLLAAFGAMLFGLLVGFPALRVRSTNLAIITLAGGVTIAEFVFKNPAVIGDIESGGAKIPNPKLGSWDFGLVFGDKVSRPIFGVFLVVILVLLCIAVANIRRAGSGRVMLAVRGNERAAAAIGINVTNVKMTMFAFSSFIAGVGGTLIAYRFGSVSDLSYGVMASLTALSVAYLGGITSVSGAVTAGVTATAGVMFLRHESGHRRTGPLGSPHRWRAVDLHRDHQSRGNRRWYSSAGGAEATREGIGEARRGDLTPSRTPERFFIDHRESITFGRSAVQ